MPINKRPRRREPLGLRIITYNGVVVDTPDVNHSINIGTNRVQCTCGSILLRGGYSYHTKRKACVDYHKLIGKEAEILKYLP